MRPIDAMFGAMNPPAKMKVYAPNGDTMEVVGHLAVRGHEQTNELLELCLRHTDGKIEVLNKRVVVKNLETGEVCYNPRTCPSYIGIVKFLTGSDVAWLRRNLHWPKVLELWDNPVAGTADGMHPGGNELEDLREEQQRDQEQREDEDE